MPSFRRSLLQGPYVSGNVARTLPEETEGGVVPQEEKGGNGGPCFPRKETRRGAGAAAGLDTHRAAPGKGLPTGTSQNGSQMLLNSASLTAGLLVHPRPRRCLCWLSQPSRFLVLHPPVAAMLDGGRGQPAHFSRPQRGKGSLMRPISPRGHLGGPGSLVTQRQADKGLPGGFLVHKEPVSNVLTEPENRKSTLRKAFLATQNEGARLSHLQ